MTIHKIKAGDLRVTHASGSLRVKRDFYMGGWRIWSDDETGIGMRWTDERFRSAKDAIAYIESRVD